MPHQRHDSLDHIVDIGEVAAHASALEQADRLSGEDRLGEQPEGHVGAAPRPVGGKEAKPGRRQAEDVRIGVRHQFVGLLGGRIEAQGVVDIVGGAERQPRIGAVDRGRGRIDEVAAAMPAAPLEDIGEACEVGVSVGGRVVHGVAHPRLSGEMDDEREAMALEQALHGRAVGQVEPLEREVPVPRQNRQSGLFHGRVVVVVQVVARPPAARCPAGAWPRESR